MQMGYFILISLFSIVGAASESIELQVQDIDGNKTTVDFAEIKKSITSKLNKDNLGFIRFSYIEPQLDGSVIFTDPNVYYDGGWKSISELNTVGQFCQKMNISSTGEVNFRWILGETPNYVQVDFAYNLFGRILVDRIRYGSHVSKIWKIKCFANTPELYPEFDG